MTVYQQMKKAAAGVLTAYETDLTKHDREFLRTHHGLIVWILRENGTHIFGDGPHPKAYQAICWFNAVMHTHPTARTFIGDTRDNTLKECPVDTARAIVKAWSVNDTAAALWALAQAQRFADLETEQAAMRSWLTTNREPALVDAITAAMQNLNNQKENRHGD